MDAVVWSARYTDEVLTLRTNLCPSATFLSFPTDYWVVGGATGAVSQFVGEARFGVYSLRRTVTSTASARIDWTNGTATIPVTVGLSYTVSAYVKSSVARTCRVNLLWQTSGGATVSTSNGATATSTTTGYTRVSLTATAPATAAQVVIQMEVTNAQNGDTHYWSAVLLEQSASLQPFFDGLVFDDVALPQRVTKVEFTGTYGRSTSREYVYTWYDFSKINEVSIFKGRRNQIDDYAIDNATLEFSQVPSWSPAPQRGNRVQIYTNRTTVTPAGEFVAFYGRITDIDVQRGLLPVLDTASIQLEGIQAEWSRAQLNEVAFIQQDTDATVLDLATYTTLSVGQFGGRSTASAITFTGSALELLNLVTRTEEARFFAAASNGSDQRGNPILWWFGRDTLATYPAYSFQDGSDARPSYLVYDKVRFRSSADDYYNQVTIVPNNTAIAEQTDSTGEEPLFSLVKDTLDFSADQGLQHAKYLLQNFQQSDLSLAEISLTDRMQRPDSLGADQYSFFGLMQNNIGGRSEIKLRGTTYDAIMEGIQITGQLDETRVTIFLSPADTNAYLRLNDALYGKLDFNKLSF
jgi:hypothetical protein